MEVTQFKERVIPHLQSLTPHSEFADGLQLLPFPDVPRSSIIHSQGMSTRKVFLEIVDKYLCHSAEWPIEITSHSALDEIMYLKQRCKGQRARFVTMKNLFVNALPHSVEPSGTGSSLHELELCGFDTLAGESNSRNGTLTLESPPVSAACASTPRMTLRLTNIHQLSAPGPFAPAVLSPSSSKSMVLEDSASLLRSIVEALDLALDDVVARMSVSFDKFSMTLVWCISSMIDLCG